MPFGCIGTASVIGVDVVGGSCPLAQVVIDPTPVSTGRKPRKGTVTHGKKPPPPVTQVG